MCPSTRSVCCSTTRPPAFARRLDPDGVAGDLALYKGSGVCHPAVALPFRRNWITIRHHVCLAQRRDGTEVEDDDPKTGAGRFGGSAFSFSRNGWDEEYANDRNRNGALALSPWPRRLRKSAARDPCRRGFGPGRNQDRTSGRSSGDSDRSGAQSGRQLHTGKGQPVDAAVRCPAWNCSHASPDRRGRGTSRTAPRPRWRR